MIPIISHINIFKLSLKQITLTGARLIAFVLIIRQTCQINASATGINQVKHKDRFVREIDRLSQASAKTISYHPYGNSFEALPSRHEILADTVYVDPIGTAASYRHHKKSVKGWLDMGAWTKKKGAFGWYTDFPVGKGK